MNDLANVDFDNGVEPLRDGYKAIPPGIYQLYLESREMKETSGGKGGMIACKFKVGMGEHEGATIYCNFNFWNDNEKTVNIAKSQWSAIVQAATGMPKLLSGDSSGLLNKTFMAEIINVPAQKKINNEWVDDPDGKRKNEIVFNSGSIMSCNDYHAAKKTAPVAVQAAPAAAATTPAPAAAPVTPGVGKKPWDKR